MRSGSGTPDTKNPGEIFESQHCTLGSVARDGISKCGFGFILMRWLDRVIMMLRFLTCYRCNVPVWALYKYK